MKPQRQFNLLEYWRLMDILKKYYSFCNGKTLQRYNVDPHPSQPKHQFGILRGNNNRNNRNKNAVPKM